MNNYADSFEGSRRIRPRLWQADYVFLSGLAENVRRFATSYATEALTVVDFGCGAKPYRPFFSINCRYVGIDMAGNPHADIQLTLGEKVPLPAGTADLLLSTQVVYLVPDFDSYLEECRRLLKPTGRMLLTTLGTWTYHPASGGDYYRFTQDGVRYILKKHGFALETLEPVVGTLGTGLHLRQLVFNSWFRRAHLDLVAAAFNVICNLRICLEDKISPHGTRMAAPVNFCAVARPV